MVKSDLFRRYVWLLDLIYRNDGITRDEINRRWYSSALNDDKESEIPERTFHRHKNAIKELFGIEIICDRRGSKGYSINRRDEIESDKVTSWMINSFAVNALLSEAHDLKERILIEPTPSGQQFLTDLIDAMRNNIVVDLQYQSFHMDCAISHKIEPYCIKAYKQRWYVIGRRIDTDNMRTFALDRIKGFQRTELTFELPVDFDAEKYFADSIGIIVEDNVPPQRVTIRASGGQQDYIRSLPLHHSQTEIERCTDYSTFELYVKPSYDLTQELLRYGEDVKVLSPVWLQEEFRRIADKMNNLYKN